MERRGKKENHLREEPMLRKWKRENVQKQDDDNVSHALWLTQNSGCTHPFRTPEARVLKMVHTAIMQRSDINEESQKAMKQLSSSLMSRYFLY